MTTGQDSVSTRIINHYLCLFVVLIAFSLAVPPTFANPSTFVPANQYQSPVYIMPKATKTTAASTTATRDDSAVLSELKATIRKQAAEIEALKKPSRRVSSGHGAEASADAGYLDQSFMHVATHRVGWLGLFLMSLSLTAVIMNGFEHTLARNIQLAYFVPLLAGHGGNTGGQSVGTVLSALSSGAVKPKHAMRVIAKEAMAGITVGSLLGCIVAPVIHYGMGISMHVATVILFTLPLVSTIAATLGSSIPFVCVAMGLDPSVIASPAMTSFVDVSGLMSYFLIANQVFKYFGVNL